MSRRGADEISGSPELQARMRPAVPAQLSAVERDRLITALASRGWSHEKIAHRVGLTRRGVAAALERIREGRPGRVRGE
jgi:transcriptional regulator with GAF, ATPase, and Fis domain